MPSYDVIVCGAGVAGLAMSRALGRQGRRVLLVDKQRRRPTIHKGELLQPRSLEILDVLGALPRLRTDGALRAPRLVCRTADGDEVGALDYQLLPEPYNHCLVHYYPQIQAAIAPDPVDGVETRLGARADRLVRDRGGRVVGVRLVDDDGEHEVDATLTVACDGPGSRLRSEAGVEVTRHRYEHELLGFDLTGVTGLGADIAAHLTPDGLRLLFPMPGDRARLYAQLPTGAYRGIGRQGLPAWAEWLVQTVPALAPVADRLRAGVATAQAMTAWRFNAPTWVRPGMALVGDAAHCVHPMAGQGMNAAIADAWALAGQLATADAFTAANVDAALARYDALRRPKVDYVARISHSLATLFTDTTWRGQVLARRVLRRNRHNRRLQFIVTYNMSGLGVRRFSAMDRLIQIGLLRDRHAYQVPSLPAPRRSEENHHGPR